MSFASEIKESLCRVSDNSKCCARAELAAAVCFAGTYRNGKIKIKTENEGVAERICFLAGIVSGNEFAKRHIVCEKPKKSGGMYSVTVSEDSAALFADMLMIDTAGEGLCPAAEICEKSCCASAFVRGAFLGGGSVSDPEKNYHAEFVTKTPPLADLLYERLLGEDIGAKMTVRKDSFVVYVKDSEAIASMLGIMGAGIPMMDFYNIKIERELRNNVNRQVNCDNANADKITAAAKRHLTAIKKVKNAIGLEKLPPVLGEIALLREQNPEMSLKELGTLLTPPIGKSGVNHRLERICEIARDIAGE